MPIFGFDGSDYDFDRGPVNVEAMVADLGAPECFVTFKATEGTRFRHAHYGDVINRARRAGATFTGAYVVPRTPGNGGNGSIAEQVDYLLAYLDEQTPGWRGWGNFFLQVDLEHWPYDAVAPAHGVTMADLIEQRTGKRPVLYAPAWAYGDTIGGSHPLWASNYGSNPAAHFRAAYPGDQSPRWAAYSGRTPAILQYGSRLTIGGQPGCDANAYRGSAAEFQQMIGDDMALTDDDATKVALAVWRTGLGAVIGPNEARKPAEYWLMESQTYAAQAAGKPTSTLTVTTEQAAAMAVAIGDKLVAAADNPLGDADKPAIVEAVKQALREGAA